MRHFPNRGSNYRPLSSPDSSTTSVPPTYYPRVYSTSARTPAQSTTSTKRYEKNLQSVRSFKTFLPFISGSENHQILALHEALPFGEEDKLRLRGQRESEAADHVAQGRTGAQFVRWV